MGLSEVLRGIGVVFLPKKIWKLVKVSTVLLGRMKGRLVCRKCGVSFRLGEEVWSHRGNGKKHITYYCQKCYDRLWFE